MIKDFNGAQLTGKVCKDSIKKFDKVTKFSLAVKTGDEFKFYTCKVFNKVKDFFDSSVSVGDTLTIQANQSVNVYKGKEYVDYLVAYFDKLEK